MATKNKFISNPKTRQEIRFLQTSGDTHGELLEMETTYQAHSLEPPHHFHPYQVEDFTVLSGQVSVRIDGQVQILKAGDTLHIPIGKSHSMWNASDYKAVVNWKVRPALQTEFMLETITGLAIDGKTNEQGRPNLLQVALLFIKFSNEFRLASPPVVVQRILFNILKPIALLLGYRDTYKKYFD